MTPLVLILVILFLIYKYTTKTHKRFSQVGIAHKKPFPLFGSLLDVFLQRTSYQENLENTYNSFKGERICGFYNMRLPTCILRDLQIVNEVFKSESSKVVNRGMFLDENDPLTMNLFFMEGHLWKTSREKLRPAFKSKNLKNLIPLLVQAADYFINELKTCESLKIKDYTSRYAARVITGPVLGLELTDGQMDEFIKHTNMLFCIKGFRSLPVLFRMFMPELASKLGIRLAPNSTEMLFVDLIERNAAQKLKMEHFTEYIFNLREYLKKEGHNKEFLDGIVIGQFFIFILAGFETTSTTLSFILYFLSKNPEIYKKMQSQVQEIYEKHTEWTYDALKEVKMVENVIFETLRLYPPVSGMLRIVSSELHIPGTDLILKPGEGVTVCISGIHKDPEYYEEPLKFNPDRFNGYVPEGAFIPFGLGPRICIGRDLAILELKSVLCQIALNFDIELDEIKTPANLEIDPSNLFTNVKKGIWIKFNPIKKIK